MKLTLSAARRFADAPFGPMLATEEKLRAAIKAITDNGTPGAGPDVTRLTKLSESLSRPALVTP